MADRRGVAAAQADRTAGLVFLAARAGQLAFSALMITNDAQRRSRAQLAVLAALSAESAWLGRQIVRTGGYRSRSALWTDTVAAASALVVSRRTLAGGAAPWAKNVAIGAAIGSAATVRRGDAVGTLAVLCAAALESGDAAGINDAISWTGTSIAARRYLTAHRRYAAERDAAEELAVERSAAAAAQDERVAQHETLHRGTIATLRRLAAATDLADLRALAGAEASRLRYALRSEGRLPQGFDDALDALVQEAATAGLTVELVTSELDASPSDSAGTALSAVVRAALAAAREDGAATRAVVRAYDIGDAVHVSIRDHGYGFASDSPYGERMNTLAALLASVGGTVRVWSEPGEGVRVDATVPLESPVDDAEQGLPHLGRGTAVAGDGEDALGEDHVDVIAARRRVAAQHDVGTDSIGDGNPGIVHEPFQPAAQERGMGGDTHRRSHTAIVARRIAHRVGSSTQFAELSAAEIEQADRPLLAAVLAWRATGLGTGVASVVAGYRSYRNKRAAVRSVVVAAIESSWFAIRTTRRPRWHDPLGAGVDALTATALLVDGRSAVAPEDRPSWLNWVPWSLATNVVSAQAMSDAPGAQRIAGAVPVIAAHAAQGPRVGDAVANVGAQLGFFLGASFFAAQLRTGAVRLHEAQAAAVAQGERLARARETALSLRTLHDSAVQTLEAIASGRFADVDAVRQRAAAEADALAGSVAPLPLDAVLAEHADLEIALVGELPALPPPVVDALVRACGEALTNVGKHAQVTTATVRVSGDAQAVMLVVADDGVGFDSSIVRRGFGMTNSIVQRMSEVGGGADVESAPNAGTRVVLRWPA
ncbi:MAG TPA: ATP-binding protein [Jatrophihabitantaceae bacterium]